MTAAKKTSDPPPMSPPCVCFLGVGANLGDKVATLRAAVAALDAHERIAVDFANGIASLYETAPVGCDAKQPNYVNTAIRVETTLSPGDLLAVALDIEKDLGRVRTARWEARVIDLDLLLYGAIALEQPADASPARRTSDMTSAAYHWVVVEAGALTLPHPRTCERRFVLAPLVEIAADVVHPIANRTISELAEQAAKDYPHQNITRIAGAKWIKTAVDAP